MDYETRQRIMRADRVRRAEREQADIDAYLKAKGIGTERNDALANHARDVRVSPKWSDVAIAKGGRRGIASVGGRIIRGDGTNSVAVYNFFARGQIKVVGHAELRKGRKTRTTGQAQTVRDSGAAYYARVASLGANTELAGE
jgi:hypothetical protein